MATRETGIAVAIIGAIGVIAAACISSGLYQSVCPESVCGTGQVEQAPQEDAPQEDAPQDNAEDKCVQGFVWREAFDGDRVCVTPETRSQAAKDNAQAGARRYPR